MEDIIKLIENQNFQKARNKLLQLVEEKPRNPIVSFYCALTHDALGMEREAIPLYEAALLNEIDGELRERTYVQLGSSYRCIGEYHKSRNILEKGSVEYPDNLAIKTFLAIVLYNLNNEGDSITSLLKTLVRSSSDPWINKYSKALEFYSDKLNKTW